MRSARQPATAAAITAVNVAVAVAVNLLTSNWSWLIFAVLAGLSTAWIGLEVWRAMPRSRKSLGTPVPPSTTGAFVPRPELTGQIVRLLLASKARKVGITTALAGAGGFGKTTLAREVCTLAEIRQAFACIEWVDVGQEVHGAALADAINDISERVSDQRPGLTSPEQAGIRLGELLESKGRSLLVVDDVWTAEQLRPFLNAGRGCTLLVTTRVPNLLPEDARTVKVDQMSPQQARDLLTGGLDDLPQRLSEQLLELAGRWPLTLNLTNAALRRAARDGADVAMVAQRLLGRLQELGPVALDMANEALRNRTVKATIESSLGMLGVRRDRVVELAIFPEDTEIPVDLVVQFWQHTADLSPDEGDQLCRELVELSLVTRSGDYTKLRLHDVIRTYLQNECGRTRLTALHDGLLNAVAPTSPEPAQRPVPWWTLPTSAEYLWRTLAYHLEGAGRKDELATLVTAPKWVIGKLRRFGPVAVAEDLALVSTATSKELSRFLDQLGHLLIPTTPDHAVVNALALRLPRSPALEELRQAAMAAVKGVPRLVAQHSMPDLPDPALNRVLVGHEYTVRDCVFGPDGSWLISAAFDGIRVWNTESGQLIRLFEDLNPFLHGNIALSPDGRLLACDGDEDAIELWNTDSWERRILLRGHQGWVLCCCFSADGRAIVSSGRDKTIRIWDAETGKQLRSFKTPKEIYSCDGRLDGKLLGCDDEVLKLWDLASGRYAELPYGPSYVDDIAISVDQRWAVVPARAGLLVYDLTKVDEPPRTLRHHTGLSTAVFSPDGVALATGGFDGSVVLWDVDEWRPTGRIAARGSTVRGLTFARTAQCWHRLETKPYGCGIFRKLVPRSRTTRKGAVQSRRVPQPRTDLGWRSRNPTRS